jgi:site-specific DNA-cytosine methylase
VYDLTGIALCAGVGGLELALEAAFPGYCCIAAVENNPQAAKRFKLRFPQAKVFEDVLRFVG